MHTVATVLACTKASVNNLARVEVAHLQLGALLPLNPGERGDHAVGGGLVTTQTLLSPLLEKPVGKTR